MCVVIVLQLVCSHEAEDVNIEPEALLELFKRATEDTAASEEWQKVTLLIPKKDLERIRDMALEWRVAELGDPIEDKEQKRHLQQMAPSQMEHRSAGVEPQLKRQWPGFRRQIKDCG